MKKNEKKSVFRNQANSSISDALPFNQEGKIEEKKYPRFYNFESF